MRTDEHQKVTDLLLAIEQIESNYGYIFKGSDEHKWLRSCIRDVKKILKRKVEGEGG